jgi:hypothetical protein
MSTIFTGPLQSAKKGGFLSLAAAGCFFALLAIPMPLTGTGAKAELALN